MVATKKKVMEDSPNLNRGSPGEERSERKQPIPLMEMNVKKR